MQYVICITIYRSANKLPAKKKQYCFKNCNDTINFIRMVKMTSYLFKKKITHRKREKNSTI